MSNVKCVYVKVFKVLVRYFKVTQLKRDEWTIPGNTFLPTRFSFILFNGKICFLALKGISCNFIVIGNRFSLFSLFKLRNK